MSTSAGGPVREFPLIRQRATALGIAAVVVSGVLLLAGCAPTPAPLPPGPTEAEAKALAAQQQQRMWDNFVTHYPAQADRDKPQVAVIRYIHPEVWAQEVAKCLVLAGVDATADQGGITTEALPGQLDGDVAYAQYVCDLQYPVNPDEQGFLSRAQLEYLYDFYTERLSPCLRLMGYQVSTAPPRSAFVEGYEANGYLGWAPYYDVRPQLAGDDTWAKIDWRCGSLPDPFPAFH